MAYPSLNDITAGSLRFGGSLLSPEQQITQLIPSYNTPGIGDGLGAPIDVTGMATGAIPGIPRIGATNGLGATFMDKAQLGLAGIGTIGSLYAAFQAQNLAKKQFGFSKRMAETNLANQVQSYNTTLEDRSRSRAAVEGQTPEQAQAYIDKNRLKG